VTVRVAVIVNGLHYGERDHRYLDELVRSPRSNYPCSSVVGSAHRGRAAGTRRGWKRHAGRA
ncbi:MAG: hypothetical protein ACRDTT_08415, partial [Pseudonocardiaceae bacterium]